MIVVLASSLFSARILSLVFLPKILIVSEALFSLLFFLSHILLIVLFSESLALALVATLALALAPEFFLFIIFILVRPGCLVLRPAGLSGALAVEVRLEVGELTELIVDCLVG